jgi:hypothetical protein
MKYEIVKNYLDMVVDIGVYNFNYPRDQKRAFMHHGFVEEVNSDYIILETKKGYRKIFLEDILSIEAGD